MIIPDKTRDELEEFVKDYLGGRIFTSAQLRDFSVIHLVFMPVGLNAFVFPEPKPLDLSALPDWLKAKEKHDSDFTRTLGVLYEYTNKAGPRTINGYPMFPSCQVLSRHDWERAATAIKRERERKIEV